MSNYTKLTWYSIAVSVLTLLLSLSVMEEETNKKAYANTDSNIQIAYTQPTEILAKSPEQTEQSSSAPYKSIVSSLEDLERQGEIEKSQKAKEYEKHKKQIIQDYKEQPISKYYVVTVDALNIRENNNAESKIIGGLYKNDIIQVKEQINGWIKLKAKGFVNEKYVTPIDEQKATKLIFQQREKEKAEKEKAVALANTQPSTRAKSNGGPINLNITSSSNVTVQQLQALLKGTQLEGIEQSLINVEDKFGINALFTLSVAKLESGHGKSRLARGKNNLFGLNAIDGDAYDKAMSFSTKGQSVEAFGRIIRNNYVNKGLTTLETINTKYSTSSSWAGKVRSIMNSDYSQIKN